MTAAAANAVLFAAGLGWLSFRYDPFRVGLWGAAAGSVLFYQILHLRKNIRLNTLLDNPEIILPDLGLANRITLLRSSLLALLTGFLFLPAPGPERENPFLWMPGMLFLTASVMDYLDGWAARAAGRSSRLGEILDMHWDGFGVLIGSALLVKYGRVPLPYLSVGLARYLYLAGLKIRELRGLPVHPLPPNPSRRVFAGSEMGFIAAALLPVYTSAATRTAALVFMVPFLAGFGRDYLYAAGFFQPERQLARPKKNRSLQKDAVSRSLLALRLLFLGLIVSALVTRGRGPDQAFFFGSILGGGIAAVGIALGVAGRLLALTVCLVSGLFLEGNPDDLIVRLLIAAGAAVFLAGTGKFSLWKPEDRFFLSRPGDKKGPL